MINIGKTSSVQHELWWVYPSDTALDREREDWESELEAALETGDMMRLPIKPNQKPTYFKLRQPSGRLLRCIRDIAESVVTRKGGSHTAWRDIASLCLVGMENAGGKYGEKHEFVTMPHPQYGHQAVSDTDMDALDMVDEGMLVNGVGLYMFGHLSPPKN